MFSNLLSQLTTAINQAKTSMKTVSNNLPPSAQTSTSTVQKQYNPRLKSSAAPIFPKSQRFKVLQKQQLTTSYVNDISKVTEDSVKANGGVIGKSERFKEKKGKEQECRTILYPKDSLVKKSSTKGAVINPPKEKDWNKSTVSVSTVASVAQFGPGMYLPTTTPITKTPSFSKGKRFLKDTKLEYTDQIPLYPKDTLTRKRPPTAVVIKKQTAKNDKQLMREREELLRERLRIVKWKEIPFEIDRYFKSNIGPVLKKEYFNIQTLEGRQKSAAMKFLLQKINFLRGGFEQNVEVKMQAPCAVVYRKSAPKPFKFPERSPAPDEYYPSDDLAKPKAPAFSFGKFDINKIPTPEDPRDYQISQDILKDLQNIIISPEHKHIPLTDEELTALKRGPGVYDAVFSLVEKRTDVGQVKYQDLTEKNDRINNLGEKKQVNDVNYSPEYTGIDKNIGVHLYKQPANVKPQHLPEAVLFPQHWVFYDGDLNKVRAEIAKNVLIGGGLKFDEYQVYANNVKQFKEYLERQKKKPEHGEYNITYGGIDKDEPGFEMGKMQQKGLIDPIVKEEGDVAGDNLILRPDKPKPNVPSFDFGKMVGREEIEESDEPMNGDVLILNPRLPEPKLPNIDFKKMVGREEGNEVDEEGPDGDRLIIHPTEVKKHVPGVDFKRQQGREEVRDDLEEREELVINKEYKQVQPRIKGFVDMERMSEVRLVAHLKKMKQDEEKKQN